MAPINDLKFSHSNKLPTGLNKKRLKADLVEAFSPDPGYLDGVPEDQKEEIKKKTEESIDLLAEKIANSIHKYVINAKVKVRKVPVAAPVLEEEEVVLVDQDPPIPPDRLPGFNVKYPLSGRRAAEFFLNFLPRYRTKIKSGDVDVVEAVDGLE